MLDFLQIQLLSAQLITWVDGSELFTCYLSSESERIILQFHTALHYRFYTIYKS